MDWHYRVATDESNIPDALAYYADELIEAKRDARIGGRLEKNSAELPGIVENRFSQLQDLEAILEHLNIRLRKIRRKHFKAYLENYQRALSAREVDKYVDGEDEVVDMQYLINEVALMRNKWLGVLKGLDIKQWQITNIIKLRTAGMEDVII